MEGFISISRKIIEWEWYSDNNVKSLFIHCLLKANYSSKNWQGKEIKRGSFISSYSKLSCELGLTVMQIRTAFAKLKKTNEITVKATNKNTLVTVVKYDDYQSKSINNNKQDNKQITIKQQTNNNQITTTNNNNNNNNKNNSIEKYKKLDSDSFKKTDLENEAEEVYKVYPTKCNNSNRSLGKSKKQLKTILKLFKTFTKDELIQTTKRYLKECEQSKTYLKNYSTFLNNLPDYKSEVVSLPKLDKIVCKVALNDTQQLNTLLTKGYTLETIKEGAK